MATQHTVSHPSAFPSFQTFGLDEVPWLILCCRLYSKSYSWRQVASQVSPEDVAVVQGKRPEQPQYPPEPLFLGDPTDMEAKEGFEEVYQDWYCTVQDGEAGYQKRLRAWEQKGLTLSLRYDLTPMPELKPYDSRPPEMREWLPVKLFGTKMVTSQKSERVPTTTRSWRQDPKTSQWVETLTQGETWKPYSTNELKTTLAGGTCLHLPETLIIAIPGASFLPFLQQLSQVGLAMVRCRWDRGAKKLVPVCFLPQVFRQPELEIVASVAVQELGCLPITLWPGAPTDMATQLNEVQDCGWEKTQQVPTTRAQFQALETWISKQPILPSWYRSPEYRALTAVNLAVGEAMEVWESGYLWRPLLDSQSGSDDEVYPQL